MSSLLAITAARLHTPLACIEHPVVLVENGVLRAVGAREALAIPSSAEHRDFPGGILLPALVALHIHGGMGCDLMRFETAQLAGFERHLMAHGVAAYLPTTVTDSLDVTLRALEKLATVIEDAETAEAEGTGNGRARALGIHLEGPFLSPEKRGVHPRELLLSPRLASWEQFWQAARGRIRMLTIAPELAAAEELIAAAAARGVLVSLGHSNATAAAARRGIQAGARHATHTFNAMRPLDHREPGIAGVVLDDDRLSADLIADGLHVDAAMMRLFLKAKGEERAVLITDAISATGLGDGIYPLGGLQVTVRAGRCDWQGSLAGSVLNLDQAVRNIMKFAGWDLARAWRLASLNPARALGLERGELRPGFPAELCAVSPAGEIVATLGGRR